MSGRDGVIGGCKNLLPSAVSGLQSWIAAGGSSQRSRNRNTAVPERGFTVVELLVYMTLSFVVVGAAVSMLIAQSRHVRRQVDITDVRETLRTAAAALSWEVQQSSAARGDLISIGAQSLVMRSIEGSATVCVMDPATDSYGVWQPMGRFAKSGDDSLLVYDSAARQWLALEILSLTTGPGTGPLSSCVWSAAHVPDMVVQVKNPSGMVVQVGSPVQKFRHVEYGMMKWSSRWWLGRRVAGSSFQVFTGPVAAPTDSGLFLAYYDDAGYATAVPANVHRLSIGLRAESQDSLRERRDSVYATLFLRNQ